MTVGELIKRLSLLPAETPVYVRNESCPASLDMTKWELDRVGIRDGRQWNVTDELEWQAKTFDIVQDALVIDVAGAANY